MRCAFRLFFFFLLIFVAFFCIPWKPIDLFISHLFYCEQSGQFFSFAGIKGISHVAYLPLIALAAWSICYLVFHFFARRTTEEKLVRMLSFVMHLAVNIGLISYCFIKDHWDRPRPFMLTEFGGSLPYQPISLFSLQWSTVDVYHDSFPSGHVLASLSPTLFFLVRHSWQKIKAAKGILFFCFCFAGLVTISRIGLGRHFFSDVCASWLFHAFFVYWIDCFFFRFFLHTKLWSQWRRRWIS